jgi:opacity protein-like surface antigen
MNRAIRLLAALIACAATMPGEAVAEWFVDAYAGAAFTQNARFTQETPAGTNSNADVSFDTAPSFGIRGGRWFEPLSVLGVGVDASHFEPHRSRQSVAGSPTGIIRERDFKISALSFDLMLRWPLLESAAYPKGQLQPYLALGPAVFVTQTRLGGSRGQSSDDLAASPGAQASAGALWQIHPLIGVFAEYRFTYFHLHFKSGGVLPSNTDVATHHLLAGASFRF